MISYVEGTLTRGKCIAYFGQVDQEVMGRLFNFGTLIISSAGISQPMEFRRAFIEAQDQARAAA